MFGIGISVARVFGQKKNLSVLLLPKFINLHPLNSTGQCFQLKQDGAICNDV